jgi:hypothetical protein
MRKEIMGDCRCGSEEERELALSCGAEESSFMGRILPGIPHEDYRVLVTIAALKKARAQGQKAPSTKDFASAKMRVDNLLVDRGIGISIPSARPGRVTR